MKHIEAQKQFIASWGAFGSYWGINRTMAQIHALLLISPDPLSQDDMMEQLEISRGNVNMNIRDLIDWGLVARIIKPGKRKEFFLAEKDMWLIATRIIKERKKRELEPMLRLVEQLEQIEGDKKDRQVKQFAETMNDIKKFSQQADKVLDVIVKAEEKWLFNTLVKLFK